MSPPGKAARQAAAERAEEIAAARQVIEARIRLAQVGVTRNPSGRVWKTRQTARHTQDTGA